LFGETGVGKGELAVETNAGGSLDEVKERKYEGHRWKSAK